MRGTLLYFTVCLLASALAQEEAAVSEKDGRLFLFNVVAFNNAQCTAKSDPTMKGTCFTASECTSKGGTTDGNCASGFGVCCMFLITTCSSTVTQNTTYVQNPSYPSSTTVTTCSYTVNTIQPDICQIRLDFVKFDIVETAATGACADTFKITSPNGPTNLPTLCGPITAGQHIYYDVKGSATSSLAFALSTTAGNKFWKINISQIECSSTMLAPNGCRQYYTGASGNIQSLNFGATMLQSLQYTACIRQEIGYCAVSFTENSATTPDPYLVGMAANANDACPVAYIQFNTNVNTAVSKFCGTVLSSVTTSTVPAAIIDNSVPFELGVVSDTANQPAGSGFNFDYTQIPCF